VRNGNFAQLRELLTLLLDAIKNAAQRLPAPRENQGEARRHPHKRPAWTAVAHRISNHLVVQAVERGCAAIGFEDLRLANMTKRANAKRDPLNLDRPELL